MLEPYSMNRANLATREILFTFHAVEAFIVTFVDITVR